MKTAVNQKEKRRVSTLYLVMIAALTAMTCAATLIIRIPVGIGYVNFGDAVVMVAGVVLGPMGAMVAGGLGSALADCFGYVVYAPFTLLIKGLEGLACGLIFKSVLKERTPYLRALIAFCVSAVIVVAGYMLTDMLLVLFGYYTLDGGAGAAALAAGIATVPGSLVQVGISVVIALIVAPKLPTLTLMLAAKNQNNERN